MFFKSKPKNLKKPKIYHKFLRVLNWVT